MRDLIAWMTSYLIVINAMIWGGWWSHTFSKTFEDYEFGLSVFLSLFFGIVLVSICGAFAVYKLILNGRIFE